MKDLTRHRVSSGFRRRNAIGVAVLVLAGTMAAGCTPPVTGPPPDPTPFVIMMKYHARCSLPGSTTQYQPAIGFRVFDLADEAWYSNIRSDEVFGAPPGYGGFGAVRRLPEEWTIPSPSNPRQGTLVVGIDCPGENVGSAAPLHTRNVYVTIPDADVAAGSYLLPAFTINR